jgi:hypothetical protein
MIIKSELIHIIFQAKSTIIQFKFQIDDVYKIGMKIVAFDNLQGGMFVIL